MADKPIVLVGLNQDYRYKYHHGQNSWFGPITEWDDMQRLVGYTVRYHPLDATGQPITYVCLEGTLIQIDMEIDGQLESFYVVLDPQLTPNLFYSEYKAPRQSQFRSVTLIPSHVYYAQPLNLKDGEGY